MRRCRLTNRGEETKVQRTDYPLLKRMRLITSAVPLKLSIPTPGVLDESAPEARQASQRVCGSLLAGL